MFQSQVCLVRVLLLMLLTNEIWCQKNSADLSSRDVYSQAYDYYRANYQPNQRIQANGLPFIVKNVNYNDARQQQPLHASERNADNAQCYTDKKANTMQVSQTSNAQGSLSTSEQSSQPSCSANAANAAKQVAPVVASAISAGTTALAMADNDASSNMVTASSMTAAIQNSPTLAELQKIVQQLYVAQAQVQLEANEIQRAQTIAGAAQQALEEASNNVRVIQAALHAAQETVAGCALRAQTTQLQLAAHDQLLFIARQKVDALSAQMVGLQAEEGIGEAKIVADLPTLLAKLKEPLPDSQKPTPIPSILGDNPGAGSASASRTSPAAQISSVSQNIQAQPISPIVPSNKSIDPNKLSEQLRTWNEQLSAHKPEAVNDKRQNLDESMLFDEYEIDELDENPEISLTEGTQLRGNIEAPANPKVNELTNEDIRTLVEFIVSTEQKPKEQGLGENLNEEAVAKKAENKKYIDDFLNSIKNSAIRTVHSSNDQGMVVRSPKTDSKITDRLLTLHESLFHPVSRQVTLSNEKVQNKNDFSDEEQEIQYDVRNELSDLESVVYK